MGWVLRAAAKLSELRVPATKRQSKQKREPFEPFALYKGKLQKALHEGPRREVNFWRRYFRDDSTTPTFPLAPRWLNRPLTPNTLDLGSSRTEGWLQRAAADVVESSKTALAQKLSDALAAAGVAESSNTALLQKLSKSLAAAGVVESSFGFLSYRGL